MTVPLSGARQIIRTWCLLPTLLLVLLVHPPELTAASQQAKSAAAKRVASKERPTEPKRRLARPSKAPAGSPKATVREPCVHVARRGESVAQLASRYGVPRRSLIAVNDLAGVAALRAGQRINVPGCRGGRAAPRRTGPPPAIELEEGLFLAQVGPDRIPTRLYMAVPDFAGDSIEFFWPVAGAIASGFGPRRGGWHAGIDIRAEPGEPVLAAAAGMVIFSGWAASYGRVVRIEHPNGFVTLYAHNSENLVDVGDHVAAGATIATVGRSGRASAEHLHFEIRRDGMAFNPVYLLDSRDNQPVLVSTATDPLGDEATDDIRE